MKRDIGIDLGTATVLVYVKGKGIVLREPSVVAIDKNTERILKIGREAQEMLGRTSGNIVAIRPLRDGVISQYDITMRMIQHFISKARRDSGASLFFQPRVILCVPSGITEVEERAVLDAAYGAGVKKAFVVEEPVAAAIGAGIDISMPNGNMLVDIGGGTTDVAVISLNDVVVSESVKVAGDKFDEAIIRYVKKKHNVLIGERTAEAIKIRIGCAWQREQAGYIDVKGRCLVQGMPRVVRVSSAEMPQALEEPITSIVEAVCSVVERTPPELIGDILRNGIVMTGGGSLLYGLDRLIANVTGIKTRVAENAVSSVAIGTGRYLDFVPYVQEGTINVSRHRQKQF